LARSRARSRGACMAHGWIACSWKITSVPIRPRPRLGAADRHGAGSPARAASRPRRRRRSRLNSAKGPRENASSPRGAAADRVDRAGQPSRGRRRSSIARGRPRANRRVAGRRRAQASARASSSTLRPREVASVRVLGPQGAGRSRWSVPTEFAWASMEVPGCERICKLVKLTVSAAMSRPRWRDSRAESSPGRRRGC